MSAVQTTNEARILTLFDELLDLRGATRAERLEAIGNDEPLLHARLLRMLSATVDGTGQLAVPVLNELQAFDRNAFAPLRTGATVNGYRLLRELGRGGMASVWLAERSDGIVKRNVALKLPLVSLYSALDIARFEQERDVLAGLAHPHIARLYDAGVSANGQPFIVLEFIDGVPITTYCDAHRLGIRERLELFLQVLAAVGHAHKHLTVHRDLKPSNVLVDVEGQVKLLDFGIAKLLSDPVGASMPQTQLGTAALTPMYAAPEQIAQTPISTLTDVYVLGLLLHELLTGVLPHARSATAPPSLEDILRTQLSGIHRPPSKAALTEGAARVRNVVDVAHLRRCLKGDLDTIVQKALRAEPEQRYSSTEQFAADLRCFLEQRPITVRPAGFGYVAGLFLRRHWAASISTACGVMLLMGALGVAVHQHLQSRANAARSVAVGSFMVDLMDDAEPTELQSHTDWKQVLDAAVLRARSQFRDQSQLHGEILLEIGRTYVRIHEPERGQQTLTEALQLLTATAPSDDPALNKSKAQLAFLALESNDFARALELATSARDDCTAAGTECAKARAYANLALSQAYAKKGRAAQSFAAMRDSVQETIAAFGEADDETAIALMNLAMMARNHGHLQEASAAIQRASAIAAPLVLRAADRHEILQSDAIIKMDLGQYQAAGRQIEQLLNTTSLPNQRARLLRLLAQVELELGRPADALAKATSAAALTEQTRPAEFFYAMLMQARAHAQLNENSQAHNEVQTVIAGLLELGITPDSSTLLRVQRIKAEILLRSGEFGPALAELEELAQRLDRLAIPIDIEVGQVLDLQACALRALGRWAEASRTHAAARARLQKQLPADHPFLLRNSLYREAAAGNWERFRSEAKRLSITLVPDSIRHRLLDEAAVSRECRSSPFGPCVIVL